jgi:hypothetical protein
LQAESRPLSFQEMFDQFYGASEDPFKRQLPAIYRLIDRVNAMLEADRNRLQQYIPPTLTTGSGDEVRVSGGRFNPEVIEDLGAQFDAMERMLRAAMDPVARGRIDSRRVSGGSGSYDPRISGGK